MTKLCLGGFDTLRQGIQDMKQEVATQNYLRDKFNQQLKKEMQTLRGDVQRIRTDIDSGHRNLNSNPPSSVHRKRGSDDIDPHKNHPAHSKFQVRLSLFLAFLFSGVIQKLIRRHFLSLYNVRSLHAIVNVPLTRDEIEAFMRGDEKSIKITADNFRYDFAQAFSSPFNKEAIEVYAKSLIGCFQSGKYLSERFPEQFLDIDYVSLLLRHHIKYATIVVKREPDPVADDLRLKTSARSTRKTTVSHI